MTSEYWSALRWFLAGWLLVSVSGFALMGFNLFRHAEVTDELTKLEEKLHAVRQQVTQNASYQPDIAFYLSHHARWQQQGITQAADASHLGTSWLALQQQWHLPHMQYEIQPSINCGDAACSSFWPGNPEAGLSMTVTSVKMRWSVNHEVEVLDWLQQLQHAYAGMFVLRGCTWALEKSTDLIAAQCELHLFNFPQMFPVSLNAK
ncbi:MAG TPA: hypothetical protein VK953_01665 [Methylophilus sp.]|nr:hypothetical protein [Methylophilus sp.]